MFQIDKDYLLSHTYVSEMLSYYNGTQNDFNNFLYDAEPKTNNYNFRHFQLVNKLGGWRWKGLFTYRETFTDLIFNKNLKGIDFGGSQRPISEHLDIVDLEDKDFYNRKVKYKSLDEVEYDIDFIFLIGFQVARYETQATSVFLLLLMPFLSYYPQILLVSLFFATFSVVLILILRL